jgi:outer membrane protein assembly factor BamB
LPPDDFEGDPRIIDSDEAIGAIADMGADEVLPVPCTGDLDEDFDIDGRDLQRIIAEGNPFGAADMAVTFGKSNCCGGIELVVADALDYPGAWVHGLAWDGAYLRVADHAEAMIYSLDADGDIISSFKSPGTAPTGIAYDGSRLWCADSITLHLYGLDPSDGSVIYSFAAPGADATGLTWDGTYLWNADFSVGGRLHKLLPDGTLAETLPSPGTAPEDLAFDGARIWHVDYDTSMIYMLDASGGLLRWFNSPAGGPVGLTWDGTHLWLASQWESRIFKIAVAHF